MKHILLAAALTAGVWLPSIAQAHFVWVVQKSEDGKQNVHVYFSEDAEADSPELLKKLDRLVARQISTMGDATELKLSTGMDSLTTTIDPGKGAIVAAKIDYGVVARNESNRYFIIYNAKSGPALDNAAWTKTDTSKLLGVDLIPALTSSGKVEVTVLWKGKPVAKSEVTAVIPGVGDVKAESDENGKAVFEKGQSGTYAIRARVIQEEKGEHNGQPYDSIRNYGTVTFPGPAEAQKTAAIPALTPPVTSGGAAIIGDSLYVYGGNLGSAHSYHNKGQSNELRRVALTGGQPWETVATGPALQGLALVAHGGKLYRVGGFTALNDEGQENDLQSQASVACFDPATGKWTDLPALPEARSSHDAAVLGDTLYVIGGWKLGGEGEEKRGWHATAWSLDLSARKPEWKAIAKPPFERRALAVAAYDNKLYVIGGMEKSGSPTTKTAIFDPETNAWYEGPAIQGEGMEGFGCSAFATGGRLYVSTIKGNLQRLSKDGKSWEIARKLPTERFFHRMLPVDEGHFVMVAGANMDTGKFDAVEIVSVE
jgi:N-acetylneuraminic acid mutarotase